MQPQLPPRPRPTRTIGQQVFWPCFWAVILADVIVGILWFVIAGSAGGDW